MDMSLQKRLGFGSRALMMGLGVVACCVLAGLLFADSSSAIPPAGGGLACKASDGKITGRGSTFNEHSEAFFSQLYEEDICGSTPEEQGGPAGNNMVIYNIPTAKAAKNGTGAAAGLAAASCRSDAYAGDANPYTKKQLEELDGKPGIATSGNSCEFYDEKITFPFEPKPGPYPFVEAGKEDTEANVMTFPIAGESVALDVNLSTACSKVPTSTLDFTAEEVSRIFGGNAQTWNDSELVGTDPELSSCTGAITRIFRQDSAAQSEFLKHYLVKAEELLGPLRPSGAGECAAGKTWAQYLALKSTEWPGLQGEGGTCSAFKKPAVAGAEEELKLVHETAGSAGYADLSDTQAAITGGDTFQIVSIENATNTGFQAPEAGTAANCNFSVLSLPTGGAKGAVGLNGPSGDTWATNNTPTNHENATDQGSQYPICALAFDFVYTGLDDTAGTNNAIERLTADQRRTLFSYFTFVLSSATQNRLTSVYYKPLPTAWLPQLLEGFQTNF
jgi:ABC-type phosphate transport system substrate-binding protein